VRENDLKTAEDVTYYTKAGGGCGNCIPDIEQIIAEIRHEKIPEAKARPRMSNIQRMRMIEDIVDKEIRPQLQADGGDIELVDIDRSKVLVSLRGRCTNCPSSQVTLKGGVEATLREKVDPDIEVEEVR
ncbi:MAG: NifU family protein, partial [Desulfovibrionales bacterium]